MTRVGLRTLITAGALALPVAAQDGGSLFRPLDSQDYPLVRADSRAATALPSTKAVPTRGGQTVRHRLARMDFARLGDARAMIDSGQGAPTLDLNLFDGMALKFVDIRSAATSSGGYSLAGRLDGALPGTAVLVVSGKVVLGSVRTALGTYTIDCMGATCHIRQVDASSLPPLAEPLVPQEPMPSPARGSTFATAATPAGPVTVDVLVVYTPAARDIMDAGSGPDAHIDLFVAEANQAFADSGANVRIRLTDAREIEYEETGSASTDLTRLTVPNDNDIDEVHDLRDETGSDLVHMIADITDNCGVAFVVDPFEAMQSYGHSYAFGITAPDCGGVVFAHEIGHNMGLRHDRYTFNPGAFPYSHGYVNEAAFVANAPESSKWMTVMGEAGRCKAAGIVCPRLLRFSNPDQQYLGDRLGVPAGEDDAADARRSLNETARVVAGYFPPFPPAPPPCPAGEHDHDGLGCHDESDSHTPPPPPPPCHAGQHDHDGLGCHDEGDSHDPPEPPDIPDDPDPPRPSSFEGPRCSRADGLTDHNGPVWLEGTVLEVDTNTTRPDVFHFVRLDLPDIQPLEENWGWNTGLVCTGGGHVCKEGTEGVTCAEGDGECTEISPCAVEDEDGEEVPHEDGRLWMRDRDLRWSEGDLIQVRWPYGSYYEFKCRSTTDGGETWEDAYCHPSDAPPPPPASCPEGQHEHDGLECHGESDSHEPEPPPPPSCPEGQHDHDALGCHAEGDSHDPAPPPPPPPEEAYCPVDTSFVSTIVAVAGDRVFVDNTYEEGQCCTAMYGTAATSTALYFEDSLDDDDMQHYADWTPYIGDRLRWTLLSRDCDAEIVEHPAIESVPANDCDLTGYADREIRLAAEGVCVIKEGDSAVRNGYQYRTCGYRPNHPESRVGIYFDACTWETYGALIDSGRECVYDYYRPLPKEDRVEPEDGFYFMANIQSCDGL